MISASDPRRGNRLKHGARLWADYVDSKSPRQLDKWMSERLRAEKKFGSQDRRFYSDLLFCSARTLTTSLFLEFILREFQIQDFQSFLRQDRRTQNLQTDGFAELVKTEDLLWDAVRRLNAERVVANAAELISDLPESVGSRTAWLELNHLHVPDQPEEFRKCLPMLLIAHGIPPSWADPLHARMERSQWTIQQTLSFLAAQNSRAPLWIRLNQTERKTEVESDLKSHELEVKWHGDRAAVVSGSFGVYQCESFKAGLFEVQDGASQQIAASVAAKPGEKIWDACAGGGGKTVALAADLRGKGALYASDIREHKLLEAQRRCQRAGFHNVRTFVWDGETPPKFSKEIHLQAGFDAVLVDAPCSSSGTWRRNPDARLRIADPTSRSTLHQLQLQLIQKAAEHVRPGGRLVYGTCSWCVDENEAIVDHFLATQNAMKGTFEPVQQVRLLGAPEMDSDTMFAAAIDKKKS